MDFNESGNYEPGIHKTTLNAIKLNLVDDFTDSTTRHRNIEKFLSFLKISFLENNSFMFTKMWIDGSFSTNKINPNDIDVIIFINPLIDFQKANIFLEEYYSFYKNNEIDKEYFSDIYIAMDIDALDPNQTEKNYSEFYRKVDSETKYWMGQFCFDRIRKPKGIFELSYLKGEFEND